MWTPTKTKKYGVAIYNWRGDTRFGLPLEIGDTVQILEECTGWYRGFATKNRAIKGIFPQSYIYLKPCKVDNEGLFESVVPLEDPVIREVTLVLREWGNIWKKLYVKSRNEEKVKSLRKSMHELLEWRRQLMSGTLTHDQTRELKIRIISRIDCGNRDLGLDLVPRQGAQAVDPDAMSIVELYQVHVHSAESANTPLTRGIARRKEPKKILTHHLYCCMRDFGYYIGEDTEIYFLLYDSKKQKYISERFLVKISKEGFSNYVEKLHSNCTIFTDLGNADLSRDLYLITQVLRSGRMLYSESSRRSGTADRKDSSPGHSFRRPHAIGAVSLAEMLTHREGESEEKEFTFKVYQTEEKDFHQLHEFIIKQNGKFNPLSGQLCYGIVISLKMLHGELMQVREEFPLLFKNTQLTRKLGFADVIMPGDVRNDLYLMLEHGEFERGGKSTGKNIEVMVVVLDQEGHIIENCLWGASGMEGISSYNSMIIYHHNSPWWTENIRLTVPIDKFAGSHVRLEYRHCSTREKTDKKLFGFSFARLMGRDGATIQDGQHELYIYKCEDASRLDSLGYLALPSHSRDTALADNVPSNHSFSRSQKETIYIRTLLCSTKLTQNVDLLSLLQWKAHPERIQESLTRVLRLGDEELVKFLQDVLDALFALFSTEDGNSTQHSGLVFHVLVSIFSLLDESKFQHFKPVMDAYIKGHFAAALVYKGLLSSVQHCAEWVSSTEKQEPIKKCFRSLEYIFKLIIQSRVLFSRATGGQFEDSFKRDLYCVLTALNTMLGLSYDVILPTQVALLQSISAVYEQLTSVLPVFEVTRLAAQMLDSLPRDLPPQLTQAKLTAIRHLVTTKLFRDDESRNILLSTLCRHLRLHLARRDELRLCTDTLADIIGFLYRQKRTADAEGKVNNCIHHDIDTLCINTLDMLIQAVLIIIDRSTPVLGCLVACLIGLLQLLDEYHYSRLWEDLMGPNHDRKPLKDFLLRVFLVFRDLVKQQVFPLDWLVIRMAANNVMLRALQELAQPLAFKFLDSRAGHFDNQLWSNYFNLAVAYLTQQSLQLEQFSEVKREKIIEKYGDMRVLMGFQILSMWSHLGEHKLHFIPSMIGPFLEVTLVPEWELRKATLHIFFDMMECEQKARGNFKQVEAELIDKLDILISENKGDDEYKQLFNTMLLDRVQSEDPAWKDSGTAFISSVTRLLERLLDYRSVIQGDENRDKRMSCTVNLLNFYKDEINRKEMYLRYIHKLHDLHVCARNYTEAGCTMLLYADQLSWNGTAPAGDPTSPAMPECQLKQILYHKIIDFFDLGKCWEKGIPLLKELAILYETRIFDYTKLSQVLKLQATFFDNILKKTRLDPEYFRVGYYGLGFPLFVRNKQFIYRGEECEKIGDFTQRLLTEFPCAQILTKITPPEDSIVNSDSQYIQICNVKPIPEPNPILSGPDIPEKIARFYYVNDVRQFRFDRVIHKGLIDKDNEFKSQWKERTTLVTESSMPGILRWFEVIEVRTEELAPIQVACDNMRTTVAELRTLLLHCTDKPDFKQLSMKLKGIIVPEVQGGIVKYQQAFFTSEFSKLWPEHVQYANELRSIIQLELLPLLEAGLARYGSLAPSELQPLHTVMCQRLSELRQSLGPPLAIGPRLNRADSIVNSPLPPLPIEKKTNSDGNRNLNGTICGHYNDGDYGDHLYTKPTDVSERTTPVNKESLTLPTTPVNVAPPIPQREPRPKSQGFTITGLSNVMSDETARTPTRGSHDYSSLPTLKSRSDSIDSSDLVIPPPRPTHHRERSLTKPPSPKLPLRHSLPTPTDSGTMHNSWPEGSNGTEEAPPLPPRGQVPDKRGSTTSLETPPNVPRRIQKKASTLSVFSADTLVDITFDEPNGRSSSHIDRPEENNGDGPMTDNRHHDLRDSGISTTSITDFSSTLNNFNNVPPYEDFDLRAHRLQSEMSLNISSPAASPKIDDPPPIPPKNLLGHHQTASLGSSAEIAAAGLLDRRRDSDGACSDRPPTLDNYSIPKLRTLDGATGADESAC